jgi:hypothetical protein
MAARAATLAFEKASDPAYCPELTEREFLRPFEPSKLYYYDREGEDSLAIPTDDLSPSRNLSYAEIKALGFAMYRSQGFDRIASIPVPEPRPERFLLVRSRVPTSRPETHLLEGARVAAGASPPGVKLLVEPERFEVGVGIPVGVRVAISNGTNAPLDAAELSLAAPGGFELASPDAMDVGNVGAGESAERVFRLLASRSVALDRNQKVVASYRANRAGGSVSGSNVARLRASAPVQVRFVPLFDVAGYRAFARETRTEWVIETLPTRVPLHVGRANTVAVEVTNSTDRDSRGTIEVELPPGASLRETPRYEAPAGGTVRVPLIVDVHEGILPAGRHSAKVPLTIRAAVDGLVSEDRSDAYALPTLAIPRAPRPPVIDGDLSDMEAFARGEISPEDLWWRKKPDGPADSSAVFHLAWDSRHFYAGVRVRDDAVVCNIAPDDVRAQLRSDAVGITIDPSGESRDTSTTIQAAAFPCTTAGFAARGFRDADANQGLMEDTAPGMEVASLKTEDGYTLEVKIPWEAMPVTPEAGDEIAVNVIVYDGDDMTARVGANISESGIGWAAFEWGGKQALPYLWPRVVLKR